MKNRLEATNVVLQKNADNIMDGAWEQHGSVLYEMKIKYIYG